MTCRRPALVLALLLAAASAAAAPPPTITRQALNARVDVIQALPLPAEQRGEVRIGRPAEERRLNRGFIDVQSAQPDWPDEGIVVASGRHRLESIARRLGRPDLLTCAAESCRLMAPLAVEAGATLIIDRLTLDMEQRAGTAIIAYGDLFISLATIWGRDGEAVAATQGRAFRPFITAYDASRTVIRDSRIVGLGYDSFGTGGLSVMTSSRDDPAERPSLMLAASLIEDLFDGVFVRGADSVEILRTKIAGAKRNGLIVRDATRDVLIADNEVRRSGPEIDNGDGIVVNRGTFQAAVLGNRVWGSSGYGIVVDRGAMDLTIAGNEVMLSGRDGIIVYESAAVDVLRNTVEGSGRSGIRVRSSADVRIEQNAFHRNGRVGVDLHDWSAMSREPRAQEEALIRPSTVSVLGNRFSANERGDCEVQGNVTILPVGGSDC